jgi:hypothetical protein
MEEPSLKNIAPYFRLSPFISVVLVISIIIVWILATALIYVGINIDYIRKNWQQEKCKPIGILIGGKENLNECVKPVLGGVVGEATSPLTYGTLVLTRLFLDLSNAVQTLRVMFDYIRVSVTNITREILARIVNLMIPLQSMFITIRDMFARLQAVFATSIYVGLATILAMKKVLELILTFVIIILIALAALIIMMWIFPFSWAVAAAFTAIFVSISIPLVLFVSVVGKVTDLGIPKIPKKPHVCFDKHTNIKCLDNSTKPIYKIKIGDILADGSSVISTLKLDIGESVMYYLNGVLVTGSHLVQYHSTWIPVSFHPLAIMMPTYKRKKIYCLNTTSGKIRIGGNIFTDWDEMLDSDFTYNDKNTQIELIGGEIHPIKNIMVGDVLRNGKVVTGIAKTLFIGKINENDSYEKNKKYYHLYTK